MAKKRSEKLAKKHSEDMAKRRSAVSRFLRRLLWVLLFLMIAVTWGPSYEIKIYYNEGTAIAKLRTLAAFQRMFQNDHQIDQDEDGVGEYGLFNELSGSTNIRGSKGGQKNAVPQPASGYAYLSRAWRAYSIAGYTSYSGYYFQIFLPHTGKAVTDTKDAQNGSQDANSINAQEKYWIAYAWPKRYRESGSRCFVINQEGQVFYALSSNNGKAIYGGEAQTPSYDAAMDKTRLDDMKWGGLASKDKDKAVDGQLWIPVEEYRFSHWTTSAVLFFSLLGLFVLDVLVLLVLRLWRQRHTV